MTVLVEFYENQREVMNFRVPYTGNSGNFLTTEVPMAFRKNVIQRGWKKKCGTPLIKSQKLSAS
jgi:hypothetical protein